MDLALPAEEYLSTQDSTNEERDGELSQAVETPVNDLPSDMAAPESEDNAESLEDVAESTWVDWTEDAETPWADWADYAGPS